MKKFFILLLVLITSPTWGSVTTSKSNFNQEGWDKHRYSVSNASKVTGSDLLEIVTIVGMETGFKNGKKNPKSSANGLGQVTTGTCNAMIRKYGKEYSLNKRCDPHNAKENLIIVGLLLKHHNELLSTKLKRKPTFNEVFTTYFLGEGDGYKIIRAKDNRLARDIVGRKVAANNWPYFYKDAAMKHPRTVAEYRKYVDNRIAATQSVYRQHTYLLAFEKQLDFRDIRLTKR